MSHKTFLLACNNLVDTYVFWSIGECIVHVLVVGNKIIFTNTWYVFFVDSTTGA